ncbi:unnamed protein product [Urochloa decumbens]|uniref:Uncharacterized protein n=1 Tax=Urochloa decumbens TaxID=240449 RepID=A0ABC9EYE7_9POAL
MSVVMRGSSDTLAAAVLRRRAMGTVAKGAARAAVHGSRSPANTAVEGREEAEEAIERGKEEKHKMRDQVEAKVGDADAQIGSASSPAPPRHSKSDK